MHEFKRDIDIALLRAFLAVLETGSMTSAAHQLNRTQAAVSQQIKRLEDLFDCALFERRGKTLALTPIGERLRGYARRLIKLNDEVWNSIAKPDFEGEVHLGVPHDIVTTFIPEILRNFNRAWPKIQVKLHCDATVVLLEQLRNGEIDLTLTTEAHRRENVLLVDQLVWVGAKNGQAYQKDPLPVSLDAEVCAFRTSTIEALEKSGRSWQMFSQYGRLEPVLATMEADMVITAFLKRSVPEHLEIIPMQAGLPALPPFFINLLEKEHPTPIAQELAKAIRTGFAGLDQLAA